MARARTQPIPPSLYRHFALVTVALTAALAMFADGENREAVAARIDQHRQQNELQRASRARFGAPQLGQPASRPVAEFSVDFDAVDRPFGWTATRRAGQARRASAGGSGVIPSELAFQAAEAGYSEEYLASLSEEERELLLKGLKDNGLLSPAERSRVTAALETASDRRSGGALTNE